MANTKKGNMKAVEEKKVAPIKVEKIVDEVEDENKKEVFAIVIGILVVAALVVGSVIYFKGDKDPLTKPNDKKDDIIDVDPEKPEPADEEDKKEDDKKNKVEKVNYVVYKECTTCTVVTLESYEQEVNTEHENYVPDMENKEVFENNDVKTKVYYTGEEGTYQIVVKGTLKSDREDLEEMVRLSTTLMTDKAARDNKLTKKETKKLAEITGKKQNVEEGYIVVGSEDSSYATHGFVVRIEEKDKIDWSKGVTVNGTVYNESVLNENNENLYTTQDDKGINIIVGVNENDLGANAKNSPIKFDVEYTTKKGENKEKTYEVDLTEVTIEYEKEKDYSDPSEATTKKDVQAEIKVLEQASEYVDEIAANLKDGIEPATLIAENKDETEA